MKGSKESKDGNGRIVITTFGKDKTGIVAGISSELSKMNVNIEDMSSSKLEDMFVMLIVCNINKSKLDINEIKERIEKAGKKIRVNTIVQSEEIFKMMHRV